MENNKILIDVQFSTKGNRDSRSVGFQLYVLRDITLRQLIEGIKYGIIKLQNQNDEKKEKYDFCKKVFDACYDEKDYDGYYNYYKCIYISSFSKLDTCEYHKNDYNMYSLYTKHDATPICELGFNSSTKIIFDPTIITKSFGPIKTDEIIDAFSPKIDGKYVFPEFNISTRQMYEFDDTPIEIISPTEPPKPQKNSLLMTILPGLIMAGIMILVSSFTSYGIGRGFMMIAFSAASIIVGVIQYFRQLNLQKRELSHWRSHYKNYIENIVEEIKKRQKKDVEKLNELYPKTVELYSVNGDDKVYTANDKIYSRYYTDPDFLTFRVGISSDVESKFEIKAETQESVFFGARYGYEENNSGKMELKIRLLSELVGNKNQLENTLNRLPRFLADKYKNLENAPLLYSLRNKGAIGIIDDDLGTHAPNDLNVKSRFFLNNMIYELCYYHSPDQLQFVMFYRPESNERAKTIIIADYMFLPHFRNLFDDKSQFLFDDKSASSAMSSLLSILNERESLAEKDALATVPHIVMVIYDDHGLKEHALANYLPVPPMENEEYYNKLGVTFIYVTQFKEHLPAYCNDIIDLTDASVSKKRENPIFSIIPRSNILETKHFRFEDYEAFLKRETSKINDHFMNMQSASRFLSVMYYERVTENGKVPSSVSMFEILPEAKDIRSLIKDNWGVTGEIQKNRITEGLSVPVGKTENGLATLDLHEKNDGPHMLAAGTTGSGKSETVISYLLSLCIKYRPDEVNLLLVDMKGGGFTKRIGNLPHVVGTVTDVDGDENGTGSEYMLGRFLLAMKAEIKRRKRLLNIMHVDSADAYINACADINSHIKSKKISNLEEIKKMKETAKQFPMTHLILVVDEFTELKRFTSENSDIDYMAELTTIARIGRSLGFHMILISQNIEGAITDDIRVNSKARLCLKVATKQASKDMLGTDVAASPYMPGNGRAYFLVDTGSKFEYFQSAYSGADVDESIPMEMIWANPFGKYSVFYNSDKDNHETLRKREEKKNNGTLKTQLEEIVDAITFVYGDIEGDISKPFMVFNQPLPLAVDSGSFSKTYDDKQIAVGIYDSPLEQKQDALMINPFNTNIMIFGGPMSGKTYFIKTLLTKLHENIDSLPRESTYIIDFGGNIGDYSKLSNVCACFDDTNEENIKRIFKEIDKRLKLNADMLKSSYYAQLCKEPEKCPPHITLIIENINAFLSDERYSFYQDILIHFCRDGMSKGLSVIATANSTSKMASVMSNFAQKIAFEMPAECYNEIFNGKVNVPIKNSGRGLINVGSSVCEFQTFLPFRNMEEEEKQLEELIKTSSKHKNEYIISAFDGDLTRDNYKNYCLKPESSFSKKSVVGVEYYDHSPIEIDFENNRSIAIYGKRDFGKTNLLKNILFDLKKCYKDKIRFVFVDDGRDQLRDIQYVVNNEAEVLSSINEFKLDLEKKGYLVNEEVNESKSFENEKFTVFVLQHKGFFQAAQFAIDSFRNVTMPALINEAKRLNCMFIYSDVRKMSDADLRISFANSIEIAFLLDSIGEFLNNNGHQTAFGDMDPIEKKAEYAKCSKGDGYYYDIEADKLKKLRFIKFD